MSCCSTLWFRVSTNSLWNVNAQSIIMMLLCGSSQVGAHSTCTHFKVFTLWKGFLMMAISKCYFAQWNRRAVKHTFPSYLLWHTQHSTAHRKGLRLAFTERWRDIHNCKNPSCSAPLAHHVQEVKHTKSEMNTKLESYLSQIYSYCVYNNSNMILI